ncbi:hypothetical protein NM208_g5036 [Fusarium decemcellulare]|uniref:Uncharacterized protein n=1 Tax=Fusarium decemcellulare TaxID=57161 RepID=A0ACC1SIQ0_9HYPO|nr:hypothetical protein NM208_g5036 [Fusarium decemcellulare]
MKRFKKLFSKRRPTPRHESPSPKPAVSAESLCLSKLEQLPFEIRNEIFLAVDTIEDLRALVHASPTFHQQYRLNRASWLWHCLQQEMGDVLIDACTADLCNLPEFRLKRPRQKILQFIDEYKQQRSTVTETLSEQPPLEDVICITSFHLYIVRPLLQQFITWTRTNLEGLSVPDQLSRTEQRRIMRGLYRFQIYCNLFGGVRSDWQRTRDELLTSQERLDLFLAEYEPWEIEEVICINLFADTKYRSVFDEVQWDLHPDNPSFDPVRTDPFTPPGAYHLRNSMFSDWYRDGMVSLGLPILSAIFKIQDHSELVETIAQNVVSKVHDWIYETTEPSRQDDRREHRYSDRDRAQDSRQKMIFNGDRDDSPPLAWVTIWQELYSNIYSNYIPEPLHKWGYIMWDAGRLVDSGAMAILDREWKTKYGGLDGRETEDPRDFIIEYQ